MINYCGILLIFINYRSNTHIIYGTDSSHQWLLHQPRWMLLVLVLPVNYRVIVSYQVLYTQSFSFSHCSCCMLLLPLSSAILHWYPSLSINLQQMKSPPTLRENRNHQMRISLTFHQQVTSRDHIYFCSIEQQLYVEKSTLRLLALGLFLTYSLWFCILFLA